MTEKSQAEILSEVHESQIRLEADVKFFVKQQEGHHRTLYGDDGTGGIVARQKRTETTLHTLMWVFALAVPALTAVAVVLVQRFT